MAKRYPYTTDDTVEFFPDMAERYPYMRDNPHKFVSVHVHSPEGPSVQLFCSPDISRVIQDFTATTKYWDFPKQTRIICDIYRDAIAQMQRDAKRRLLSSNREGENEELENVTVRMECSYWIHGPWDGRADIRSSSDSPKYVKDSIDNFDFTTLKREMVLMILHVLDLHKLLLENINLRSLKLNSNFFPFQRFLEHRVYLPNRDFTINVRFFLSRSWRTLWYLVVQGTTYHVDLDSTNYSELFKRMSDVCELFFSQLIKFSKEHGPYLPENKPLPQPSGEPSSEYDIMIEFSMDLDLHASGSIVVLDQCPDYLTSGILYSSKDLWHTMTRLGYETTKCVQEKTNSLRDREEDELTVEYVMIPYMKDNGPFRIRIAVDFFVRYEATVTVTTLPASLERILWTHPTGPYYYPRRIRQECSSLVERLLGVYDKVKPYRAPPPGWEPDVAFTYVTDESMITLECIDYGPNTPADLPGKVRQTSKNDLWSLLGQMARLMFREYLLYHKVIIPFGEKEGIN